MPRLVGVTALEETIKAEIQVAIARYMYRNGPKDRAVAIHESAHAVVNHISRSAPIDSVSIDDLTATGEMANKQLPRPDGMPDEPKEATLRRLRREHPVELARALGKQVTVFLAGGAADEYGGGLDRSASRDDEAEAAKLADLAVDRAGRDDFIAECRATAQAIIRDAWGDVTALATLIQEHRRLPGNVVETWLTERPRAGMLRDEYVERYARMPALED
jgi:hypothetical protein